jgi:hypothetical protein
MVTEPIHSGHPPNYLCTKPNSVGSERMYSKETKPVLIESNMKPNTPTHNYPVFSELSKSPTWCWKGLKSSRQLLVASGQNIGLILMSKGLCYGWEPADMEILPLMTTLYTQHSSSPSTCAPRHRDFLQTQI